MITASLAILLGVFYCSWQFFCYTVAETVRRRKSR